MDKEEDSEELDAEIRVASTGIIHGLAKRVESGGKDGKAYLHLYLEHLKQSWGQALNIQS